MWLTPVYPRSRLSAFKYTLYFLSISGLFSLPMDETSFTYKFFYNSYFVFLMSNTIVVTLLTGLDLFDNLNDVDILADHGVIFSALVVMLIKQNGLVKNKRKIELWLARLQSRYNKANAIERIRFVENDKESFYQIKIFSVIWILITSSYFLPIYFNTADEFQLPTVSTKFFDPRSMTKFFFIYAWNIFALSVAILGVFSTDLFMVAMYNEAASRLRALGDVLENIELDQDDSSRSDNRRFVKESVDEHGDVVKLIGELNDVFYWTLLIQSVFVAVIVAGCGFYGLVSILHGDISSFVKSIMYIFGVLCENWLYCRYGDRLKTASLNITQALWKSNWYKLESKDRKSVLLMMIASGNVLHMSAGKIFRMDLERLGFILSSAYSYFTVLRNFT